MREGSLKLLTHNKIPPVPHLPLDCKKKKKSSPETRSPGMPGMFRPDPRIILMYQKTKFQFSGFVFLTRNSWPAPGDSPAPAGTSAQGPAQQDRI